ncbi:MAG: sodium:solute symporter family protein, partial [Gemmatimonadetes bacterium]|nr:sodium:solute symporter family protein [Gemmatimonadota bacterium]
MADQPYGPGAFAFLAAYLVFMIVLGYVARARRRDDSMSSFYLAGKNLGALVLFFTLYATQYSGNTLIGYPGEAYRLGYAWTMSVGFMMAIVVAYLLFAPPLYRASQRGNFVTPGDWITHRFGENGRSGLTLFAGVLFVVAIANYLLAQLLAVGHIVSGLSGGAIPFWAGVVVLAVIILFYETLGGMQAVAWTDCIQGLLLFVGLLGMLAAVVAGSDRLGEATAWIIAHQPSKAVLPGGETIRTWISTILLVGFAAAVYPQAIQRIFAARSTRSLKRSFTVMAFMPLVTISAVVLVGILAIPQLSGLEGVETDQVMPRLLRVWAAESLWLYVMTVLVLTGIVAAIMSTADSVLLSLSSLLVKDVLGRFRMGSLPEVSLTAWGKRLSWIIMAILVLIALTPDLTLWGLIELKMEVLIQTAPLFVLGVLWPRFNAAGAAAGMASGTALAAGLTLAGMVKVWGWHAGVLGLALNVIVGVSV